jgi:FkbM family methyltransferase
MYEYLGWNFPDVETHFPKMLQKNVDKGGPSEYQMPVRHRSLALCPNRRTALDVGANVGLWSRDLVDNFAKVIAFEPVAMFRECLEKNVSGSNFFISPLALGDQDTTANMIITEGNTGHSHLDPASMGQGDVHIVCLDNLKIADVDYIKIDCEGYEYRVLQGAEQTVRQYRPIVVIEQKPHDAYSKEYGQFAAIELLQSWGMSRLDQVKDDWIMGWNQ